MEPTAAGGIADGATLSGFKVQVSDLAAPTTVKWFAIAFSSSGTLTYGGGDNFNRPDNPGWEGTASPVPEPATLALMGAGLAALARKRRR